MRALCTRRCVWAIAALVAVLPAQARLHWPRPAGLAPSGRAGVADHVYQVLLYRSRDFGYTSTDGDVTYRFDLEVYTDSTVSRIEFYAPGAAAPILVMDRNQVGRTLVDGLRTEYDTWYDADAGVGGAYAWEILTSSENPARLWDRIVTGWYRLHVSYTGGGSDDTQVWFGLYDGNGQPTADPLPDPQGVPVFTTPAGSVTRVAQGTPVPVAWSAVADPAVNAFGFEVDPYPGQGIEEDDEFFLLLPNAAGSHTLTRTGAWEVSFIHGFTQGAADDEPLHNADGVRVSIVNYNRSVYDVIIGGGRLYSISGAVAYGGPEAGPIYVQVFPSRWDVQPPPAPLDAMLVLAGTRPSWDYAVRYLPAGVSLYLRAFMDANSNGLFDAGSDPCGGLVNAAGDPAPVVLDADLTGVELNLRGLSWRLAPGWNAVSPPAATTLTLGEIVPHTRGERTAGAWWGWDAAAARYVWLPTDHVPARQAGLWTCSETDRVGALLNDETDGGAVNLAAGWNLVGPAARTILPAHPSLCATAWRWDGPAQAYHRVVPGNFLEPGQAYWLLAFEPVPELPLPSPAPGTAGR